MATIIEQGINAAVIAIKDIGLISANAGNTAITATQKTRIKAMLANVNMLGTTQGIDLKLRLSNNQLNPNYGYFFPWHAACVATWWKEAGIPIPPTGAMSAPGWVKFFAGKKQEGLTPIIGCVVIHGTVEKKREPTNIGLVVKITSTGQVIAVEVVTTKITGTNISQAQSVIINPSSVLTYIYPKPIEDSQLKSTAANQETEIEKQTGEIYFPDPNNKTKEHLVYIQRGDKKTTGGFTAPWALHCYGPLKPEAIAIPWDNGAKGKPIDSTEMKNACKAFNLTRQTVPNTGIAINDGKGEGGHYSDLGNSGCGLHAAAAVFRMLTGTKSINPGYLATIGGNFHSINVGSAHAAFYDAASPRNTLTFACGCTSFTINTNDEPKATKHMNNGGFIIAVGKGDAPFSTGGHFIYFRAVVVNTGKENTWYVGNSYGPLPTSTIKYTWAALKSLASEEYKLYGISAPGNGKVSPKGLQPGEV